MKEKNNNNYICRIKIHFERALKIKADICSANESDSRVAIIKID